MRVLMISSSYPRFPGDVIAPFIEEMAAGVAARGWDVYVLLPWNPRLEATARRGVKIVPYRFPPFDRWGRWGYASSMVADERLHWQAYVVALPALIAMAVAALKLAKHLEPDLVHVHWVVPNGLAALAIGNKLPLVTSLHGSDVFLAERATWARSVAKRVFQRSLRTTACSSDLLQRALRLGALKQEIRLLPYGVDHIIFQPKAVDPCVRRKLGLPEEGFLFLGVGRLVRKKGFHVLIEAAAHLRSLTGEQFAVAIAGSGDLQAELAQRIADLQLQSRVKLLGPVDRETLPELYRAADGFVLPIVRDEKGNVDGLPNVLLEAMASGLPVVASALAGALDALEDGVTGLLVPPGDAHSLAKAMARVLNQRIEAKEMGAAARQVVLKEFTWNQVSQKLSDLYLEAMGS